MLNFERITPLFQPNQQIALADESREVVRFEFKNFLQRLERIFVPFGAFEILCQF